MLTVKSVIRVAKYTEESETLNNKVSLVNVSKCIYQYDQTMNNTFLIVFIHQLKVVHCWSLVNSQCINVKHNFGFE